jgi:integrase
MGKQEATQAARELRRVNRQGKQLKSLLITPGTRSRYALFVQLMVDFWAASNIIPIEIGDYDEAVAEYLEYLYQNGDPLNYAIDAVAGLQFLVPKCKRQLPLSWKYLKAWENQEPPIRAIPLTPLMTLAFAGAFCQIGFPHFAAVWLLAFDTCLRTGEMFSLRRKHLEFFAEHVVIKLEDTKTSVRKAAYELAIAKSHLAVQLATASFTSLKPADLLIPDSYFFRNTFKKVRAILGLDQKGINLYSLRRGGATADFLDHGSMEKTLLKGRWSSSKTARIYLQDAVATLADLQLDSFTKTKLTKAAKFLNNHIAN